MTSSDANRRAGTMPGLERGEVESPGDRANRQKRAAAEAAARFIEDGMVVGLGTGSTAEYFIRALGERVAAGLTVVGVPTSQWAASLARSCGIPLTDLQSSGRIDITVDGADEIDRATLSSLKGRGGAMVREKLVAIASERVVLIADESKLVDRLGFSHPVPVEVISFGWLVPAIQLDRLGGQARLRTIEPGTSPFISDNGNLVLDVAFGPIDHPVELARSIKAITGVVDHGLFIDIADSALIGTTRGVTTIDRPG